MNILGIIPARGGSKGIKKKNIKNLAGKPLIFYSINEAKKSKFLTKIVVSTDDSEITKISKKYGIQVIPRPKKLALDTTHSQQVFQHAIRYLKTKENFDTDVLVVLQPTSPLRTVHDIDMAIKKFHQIDCNSVVSITKVSHPIDWMYKLDDGILKKISKTKNIDNRQEASPVYQLNGAVYVIRRTFVMKNNGLIDNNTYGYIMPVERSIDIDTNFDFELAEYLISKT